MSHQITYRYYIGIFSFLNENFLEAESELSFAFQHCHRYAYRNQESVAIFFEALKAITDLADLRRILAYLIPLRLLRGVLPSARLLDNYSRLSSLYKPFVTAYRIGDLKRYDDALLSLRGKLVRRGSFLVVERAREGCLRMLFKKVCVCPLLGTAFLSSQNA